MIVAVAQEPSLTALVGALHRAGLYPRPATLSRAARTRGFAVGVDLAVLGFRPGAHPVLEAELFGHASLVYADADAASGTVGPATSSGSAPCPVCLADRGVRSGACEEGLAWAAASAAMEAVSLTRLGVATLFGTSLTWSMHRGLSSRRFERRASCTTLGCRS